MTSSAVSRRAFLAASGAAALAAYGRGPAFAQAGTPAAIKTVEDSIAWAKTSLPASSEQIIRAAAQEGTVDLKLGGYGDDAIKAHIAAFNKRYPWLKVTYSTASTSQAMQRFNAELGAKKGVSDFWTLGTPAEAKQYVAQGAFADFTVSEDAGFPASGKQTGKWYAWGAPFTFTTYRKGALKPEEAQLIRNYAGLADPRFKGRLGIVDVGTSGSSTTVWALLNKVPNGPAIFDGIAKNKPIIKTGSPALVDGLLAGEYDIGLFCSTATGSTTAQQGAPIEFVITTPAVNYFVPCFVFAYAPHPNAGKLFLDWHSSKEGQRDWMQQAGLPSARTDVEMNAWYQKQPWFYFEQNKTIDIDWADLAAKDKEISARFKAAFQQ